MYKRSKLLENKERLLMTSISEKDKTVLRKLAEKKAQIAALPIQKQRIQMWTCLNRLESVKSLSE